jgi:vancomycin permeability regulator SanA
MWKVGYNEVMISRILKIIGKVVVAVLVVAFLLMLFIPPILYFYYRRFIYKSVEVVTEGQHTLLVLGAGLWGGDTPSHALQDRLDVAVKLSNNQKVGQIIVSGAEDSEFYDEPKVMKETLVKLGVSDSLIIEDDEGNRTYESCYRAKYVYNKSEVVIISQGYHLPRALFLCRSMGIDALGVYSTGNFSTYYSRWYTVREVAAMYVAVWDIIRLNSR